MSKNWRGILVLISLGLSACSTSFQVAANQLVDNIKDNLGCPNLKSSIFDSMYSFLESERKSPTSADFSDELDKKILSLAVTREEKEKLKLISQELIHVLSLMNEEANQKENFSDAKSHLRFLIQLEFQNQSTPTHVELNHKLNESIQKIRALESGIAVDCQQPNPRPAEPLPKTLTPAQFGGHFAFATAYQSCQVLTLPDISSNTENVVGIKLGENVGGGYARSYASIPDIQRTHYYIRGIEYANGCFSVKEKPLVYDFGGEPLVEKSQLNFFVDAGIGGPALGLDCSSFVSSALAAAGLRYAPNVENKPIFVRQTSYDFIDPEKSGWKCFERVSFGNTQGLTAGDIMAIEGHVVMVDNVGPDPFGISEMTSKDQCVNVNAKKFNFSILQSSPSKGSIGINRYIARDYLTESNGMRTAFESYAQAACNAKTTGTTVKVQNSKFGLIRHKGTPECLAPRVQLAKQACISSCQEFQ